MEENLFENIFDEVQPSQEGEVSNRLIQAYQVVRVVKKISMGQPKYIREIKDTIMVERGESERCRKRAEGKARLLGNCMVVEISERIIFEVSDADEDQTEQDEF